MKFNIHIFFALTFASISAVFFMFAFSNLDNYPMNFFLLALIGILFAYTHLDSYLINKLNNRIKPLEQKR